MAGFLQHGVRKGKEMHMRVWDQQKRSCVRVWDQRKRSCVRVWDPRKLYVSVYEKDANNLQLKSVILRRTSSLNYCSKLKGQYTDVKSGCITLVGPSLNPHSLSLKKNSHATVPLSCVRCISLKIVLSKIKGLNFASHYI